MEMFKNCEKRSLFAFFKISFLSYILDVGQEIMLLICFVFLVQSSVHIQGFLLITKSTGAHGTSALRGTCVFPSMCFKPSLDYL